MFYRDTSIEFRSIDAILSADQTEAESISDMLAIRDGQSGITRSIRAWLVAREDVTAHDRVSNNYVVRGEAARQIRRAIAEAATGSVVSIHGQMNPLPNDLVKQMNQINTGDDALSLNQAPTGITAFEVDFYDRTPAAELSRALQQYEQLELANIERADLGSEYVGRHAA